MGKLHPINKEQHCCWMRTEAFIPVCFHWILFKNTSCRHQRTMAHHWKNSVPTPGSIAQYVFCQGLGYCALLRPRSLKAVSDTRDQLCATTGFKSSKKKCRGLSQEEPWDALTEKYSKKLGRGVKRMAEPPAKGDPGARCQTPLGGFDVQLNANHC